MAALVEWDCKGCAICHCPKLRQLFADLQPSCIFLQKTKITYVDLLSTSFLRKLCGLLPGTANRCDTRCTTSSGDDRLSLPTSCCPHRHKRCHRHRNSNVQFLLRTYYWVISIPVMYVGDREEMIAGVIALKSVAENLITDLNLTILNSGNDMHFNAVNRSSR